MTDQQKKAGFGDSLRTGFGILNAFKDALEETLQEAVERGDLTAERARQAMRDVAQKAQASLEDAREKVDLVSRRELEALEEEVRALRARVDALESRGGASGPEAR